MKINGQFLERFREIRSMKNRGEPVSDRRKKLWAEVREHYQLPDDEELSVELDGIDAGELRVKGTGLAWEPDQDWLDMNEDLLKDEGNVVDSRAVRITAPSSTGERLNLGTTEDRPASGYVVLGLNGVASVYSDVNAAMEAAIKANTSVIPARVIG
jgi:hypothetical protein